MASAQTLNDLQWKNRILLVMEQGDDTLIFQNQLDEFDGLENELEERKILIYQIKNNSYRLGLYANKKWKSITDLDLLKITKDQEEDFKVVLIGLDGSVKKRQSNMMTSKQLFSTIDSMPMRQQELRNEKEE